MAIDTREKRQSASRAVNPFARILPVADGTIDQGDRQHAAGFYSGILAIAAAVLPFAGDAPLEGITMTGLLERIVTTGGDLAQVGGGSGMLERIED